MKHLENNMYNHNKYLGEYACKEEDAKRIEDEQEDFRSPFFHDIDRIIYSYSYMRYMDKTQVFSNVKNDHITKRMNHVQMVSKIARTIGRALGLNEDLIEAASLGHDLGHVPFGHYGESVLNEISLKHNEGYFNHNVQSVRLLMNLENKGLGLNLNIQVLDAIMCHNGEFVINKLTYVPKTIEQLQEEYLNTYHIKDYTKTLKPMTLEGCVVRISDVIAYLGRDINDALSLNLFTKKDIPSSVTNILGTSNSSMINTIVKDIINNSLDKPYIKMSDQIFKAIKDLKKWNYENIYDKSLSKEEKEEIKEAFNIVYDHFLHDLQINNQESLIYTIFLNHKNGKYQNNTTKERIVLDFIAGMTDDFLIKCYKEIKNTIIVYNKEEV